LTAARKTQALQRKRCVANVNIRGSSSASQKKQRGDDLAALLVS
jgi:hypothetical protein